MGLLLEVSNQSMECAEKIAVNESNSGDQLDKRAELCKLVRKQPHKFLGNAVHDDLDPAARNIAKHRNEDRERICVGWSLGDGLRHEIPELGDVHGGVVEDVDDEGECRLHKPMKSADGERETAVPAELSLDDEQQGLNVAEACAVAEVDFGRCARGETRRGYSGGQ
jgi:hypothetical protein